MIESLFSNLNVMHLLELFFWLLGAFLIGLYFGTLISKKNKNKPTSYTIEPEELNLQDDVTKIRAKKTFDRGGKEMVKTSPTQIPNNGLNFNRIGIATIEQKDNLKLIKGIGSSIEEKLNGIGIFTFQQIGNFNAKDIDKITELIKFFPGRIERDDWVGQAYNLLNNDDE